MSPTTSPPRLPPLLRALDQRVRSRPTDRTLTLIELQVVIAPLVSIWRLWLLVVLLTATTLAQTNRLEFKPLGTWSDSLALRSLDCVGVFAYVGNTALTVIDVSDPRNPTAVGVLALYYNTTAVRVANELAYLLSATAGFRVADVSNPRQPRLLGITNTSGIGRAVEVVEKRAFVAWGSGERGGIHIIDLTNASAPAVLSSLDVGRWTEGLAIEGTNAFLAAGNIGTALSGRLISVNVGDPVHPVVMDELSLPVVAQAVRVAGRYAYVLGVGRGLYVVDVAEPHALQVVGEVGQWGQGFDLQLRGHLLFAAIGFEDDLSVVAFALDDPRLPKLIGSSRPLSYFDFGHLSAVGEKAYLATGTRGLMILEAYEFPAFIQPPIRSRENLTLKWNSLPGVRLQSSVSLAAPDWQDVPGVEGTNTAVLPIGSGPEFFRLVRP